MNRRWLGMCLDQIIRVRARRIGAIFTPYPYARLLRPAFRIHHISTIVRGINGTTEFKQQYPGIMEEEIRKHICTYYQTDEKENEDGSRIYK